MCITIKVSVPSGELWLGHGFWVFVNCDLDLRDMSLAQGYGSWTTVV